MFIAILLFVGTLLLSLWAQSRVKSTYNKYLEMPAGSGMTGAQAAALVMQRAGIHDVEILEQDQFLGDHYDPSNKRLVLSRENYNGTSVSAVGVAAHEAGHAIQHKQAYGPLEWRMAAVGITGIASQVVMWLPLIGMFTGFVSGTTMMWIMALGWGVIMAFQLVTLPVEFDASSRAKKVLNELAIVRTQEEANGVSAVLSAAAWTYVAAFITSLGYLLYHLLPLIMGRSDEE